VGETPTFSEDESMLSARIGPLFLAKSISSCLSRWVGVSGGASFRPFPVILIYRQEVNLPSASPKVD
jgi:hypothetical protein